MEYQNVWEIFCATLIMLGTVKRKISKYHRNYKLAISDANNEKNCDDSSARIIDDLIAEQTPGGLNEQALQNWEQLDGLDSFEQVMDAILSRINA